MRAVSLVVPVMASLYASDRTRSLTIKLMCLALLLVFGHKEHTFDLLHVNGVLMLFVYTYILVS